MTVLTHGDGEMKTLSIRPATVRDLSRVIGLIEDAADWLRRTKDTDQWARPWPSRKARRVRVRKSLEAGKTWIGWDGDIAVATITIENEGAAGLPRLWTWEDDGPAVSVHRLVVRRSHAGLGIGAALLNWAGHRAEAVYGAKWIRIDVWTTNVALQNYYEQQGFQFVRYHHDPGYPSGALFQRRVTETRDVPGITLVPQEDQEPARSASRGGLTRLRNVTAIRPIAPAVVVVPNVVLAVIHGVTRLERGKLNVTKRPY